MHILRFVSGIYKLISVSFKKKIEYNEQRLGYQDDDIIAFIYIL